MAVYKEWTHFCGFKLTSPGVVKRFRCALPSSTDGVTMNKATVALYRLNIATDTLERVQEIGTVTTDSGYHTTFEYEQVLPAGIYFIGYRLLEAMWNDPTGYAHISVQSLGQVLPLTSTFRVKYVGLPESLPYSASAVFNFDGYGAALAAVRMGGYA